MFTDELRNKVWSDVRQRDLRAFGKFLTPDVFLEAAALVGARPGKSALSLAPMVWLGISCAIYTSKSFCGVHELPLKILDDAGKLHLMIRWLMVEAGVEHGIEDPLRLSFKESLEELTDIRQSMLTTTPERATEVLPPRLLERIAEHRVPLRPGRHYPRPKDSYARHRKRTNRKQR